MNEPFIEEKFGAEMIAENYPFLCRAGENHGLLYHTLPHWHHYIELIYISEGEMDVMIKGEKHTLLQGDVIWIDSGEVHASSIAEGIRTRIVVLQVLPSVFYTSNRTIFEAKYILPLLRSNHTEYNLFRSEKVENSDIPYLMEEILREFSHKEYAFELAVRTGINRIFLWLLRYWKQIDLGATSSVFPSKSELVILENLVKHIEVNFSEKLQAKEMAKFCCMSYSYFSRYFKRVMGKSFIDYLNFVRILEAEKLLLTTDSNITEIALRVGYPSTSYSIELFKKIKGISPKQYRNNVFSLH